MPWNSAVCVRTPRAYGLSAPTAELRPKPGVPSLGLVLSLLSLYLIGEALMEVVGFDSAPGPE